MEGGAYLLGRRRFLAGDGEGEGFWDSVGSRGRLRVIL